MTLGIEKLQRLVRGQLGGEYSSALKRLPRSVSDELQGEKEQIREYCRQRRISSLFHFTPLQNLDSIVRHGLTPREELDKGKIPYFKTDLDRMDGVMSAVSLSVSFPNYRMFFKKRYDYPNWDWVVIEIKANVLWEMECDFFQTNAANRKFTGQSRQSLKLDHFKSMFASEIESGILRKNLKIPLAYSTDPQAEVLVYGRIDPSLFMAINVDGIDNFEKVKGMIDRHQLPIRNAQFLFKPRQDYAFWQES